MEVIEGWRELGQMVGARLEEWNEGGQKKEEGRKRREGWK